ncbi:MAG: helix-turn-helix domain-containing protein [Anaerolineae bacterium]|nr:helix-turn-helix domain-containing protein [Anaerolineae bacterium]
MREAGVPCITASRVLNGKVNVTPETREHVLTARRCPIESMTNNFPILK